MYWVEMLTCNGLPKANEILTNRCLLFKIWMNMITIDLLLVRNFSYSDQDIKIIFIKFKYFEMELVCQLS